MNENLKVFRTERGWPAHFIGAANCWFRRNTLLRCGDNRIIVSTVGGWNIMTNKEPSQIGAGRYFETMAFKAKYDGRYWDANHSEQIPFESQWCITHPDADDQANSMHENVVNELSAWLVDQQV